MRPRCPRRALAATAARFAPLFLLVAACGSQDPVADPDSVPPQDEATEGTLVSMSFYPGAATIESGAEQTFRVYGWFSDITSREMTPEIVWSSSSPEVAAISPAGVATAVSGGTTTIEAIEPSGKKAHTSLVVRALTSLEITPATDTMPTGVARSFRATATYSDTSTRNVSGEATWVSSDPSVAEVSSVGGLGQDVKGIAPGAATITAWLGDASAAATVEVTPPAVDVVNILPSSATIGVGMTVQLEATATFSDGTQQVVTADPGCVWYLSRCFSTTAASVSAGLVTGVEPGFVLVIGAFGENYGLVGIEVVP